MSPAASTYRSPFELLSASSGANCSVISNGGASGACITAGQYGNNERCVFRVNRSVALVVTAFDTAENSDGLIINGLAYSGSTSQVGALLNGVRVHAGRNITWQSGDTNTGNSSDDTVGHTGFVVCAVADGTGFTLPPGFTLGPTEAPPSTTAPTSTGAPTSSTEAPTPSPTRIPTAQPTLAAVPGVQGRLF